MAFQQDIDAISSPVGQRPLVGPPRQAPPQSPTQSAIDAANLERIRLDNASARDDLTGSIRLPGDPTLQGPEYLASIPDPSLRAQIRALSDGRLQLPTGRALASHRWQLLLGATAQFDPSFDQSNANSRRQARRAFTSGPQAQNRASINTALRHLDSFDRQIDRLGNFSGVPILNRTANQVRNAYLRQSGNAGELRRLEAERNALVAELTRAFRGTGGDVHDLMAWEATFDEASSPEELHAVASSAAELLNGRLSALGDSYDTAMGRSSDHYELLSPDSRRIISAFGFGPPPTTAQPGEQIDRTTPTVTGEGLSTPQRAVSHGDVATALDPAQERIFQQASRRISTMLKQGAPDAQIRAYGQSQGIDVSPALNFRRSPAWREWRQQRPNEMYPLSPPQTNRQLGTVEGAVAGAAASGPGTAFINSGNAIIPLPLISSALGGDPEDTRLALAAGQQEHPGYALAGTLAGAAASYNVAGRGANLVGQALENAPKLGALANFLRTPTGQLGAFAPRAVAGDALYGAIQGEGEGGNPFAAGAENIAGGAFGRGAFRTAGRFAAPTANYVHDPLAGQFGRSRDMRDLYAIGSRPSPGQRFGGLANNVEQRMQDIPLVGDAIRGTRNRARDQFRTGVFNDALGQIDQTLPRGASPTESHQFLQMTTHDAYDEALRSMTFNIDPQATTELGQLQQRLATLRPEDQNSFNQIWSGGVARRIQDGSISGEDLKAAMSELRQRADALRPDPTRTELADTLDHAQNILESGARRASPPEAVAALDAADAAYARRVQIENAAKRRGGEMGDFTPLQYDAAVQQGSSGIRNNQYLAGGALNSNLAQQGKMLADTIPDSGTPSRMMSALGVNALAGGGSFVEPHTLGALGMTGLAYAPGVRNLTTGMLAPTENLARRRISQFLKNYAGSIGGLGGPLLNYEIPRK